ncbi:MAG: hypothetical protein EOO16_13210, partial [Chitinophagaceae bacterium]
MSFTDLKVSIYKGVTDNKGTHIKIADIGYGGNPEMKRRIEQLRAAEPGASRDALKKKLPGVTWSGTFKTRKDADIIDYTGLVCIDIDHLNETEHRFVKKRLKSDPCTFLIFTSPSGDGLKVLFRHAGGAADHLAAFEAIKAHIEEMYGVPVDEKCKNLSRLCFLSYDEDAYLNEKAKLFEYENAAATKPKEPKGKSSVPVPGNNEARGKKRPQPAAAGGGVSRDPLEFVRECTDKACRYGYAYGQEESGRNWWIFQFASIANREGISHGEAESYLLSMCSDKDADEVKASVRSGYNHNDHGEAVQNRITKSNENKKGKGPQQQVGGMGKEVVQVGGNTAKQSGKSSSAPQFWVWEEDDKGRARLKLLYNELVDFLAWHGFYRLPLKDRYEFVHVRKNVVYPVTTLDMKDFVFEYLIEHGERDVLEMCRRGSKNYFTAAILDGLPKKEVKFKSDTEKEAFVYFKNGYVEVTAQGMRLLPYEQLDGAIWGSKLIDHHIELKADTELLRTEESDETGEVKFFSPSVYAQFIWLCAHNDEDKNDRTTCDLRIQKFYSMVTATGYLLHEFKNPTITKAVVAVDHKIGEKHEQNG